jgi:molybdenum cofactor biosynthesis enzyme MoaA
MSKTYCPYPFIGASLQSDNLVLPCGQYMDVAQYKGKTIHEARKHMQCIRAKMLNGEHDSGCQCPAEEAAGLPSMRQEGLRQFGVQPFGPLKTVEIFFDNVCNLKCRMCSSTHSHLWYDEEKELYGRTFNSDKYVKSNLPQHIDVARLEEIKIYGGEPLQSLEAEDFFKRLLDEATVENLTIEMSTNATKTPMPYTLEVFKRCKKLKINLSIDAYGKLNEFIRSGSKWDDILQVMDFFNELCNNRNGETSIQVHSAVGVYNANKIHELETFVLENYPKFSKTQQMIQFPIFLNIQNMPEEYKTLIDDSVNEETKKYMYNKISDNTMFNHFVNFHRKLNTIRNEELLCNDTLQNYISQNSMQTDSTKFFVDHIKFLTGEN